MPGRGTILIVVGAGAVGGAVAGVIISAGAVAARLSGELRRMDETALFEETDIEPLPVAAEGRRTP